MTDVETAHAQWEALGRLGFLVSICCGPCGAEPFRWTVTVLNRNGQEFVRPFGATSFTHAVEIAYTEVIVRGWIEKRSTLS